MNRRVAVALLVIAVALAGCTVPRERDSLEPGKVAVTEEEVEAIFERYQSVRATAATLLEAKPLSTVESGAVLDIDAGSFEVSQRLSEGGEEAAKQPIDVEQVAAPRFGSYPLWFLAVVRDEERSVNRVQIFERESAADPWLLVATPETVLDAELPDLRETRGAALRVSPDDGTGMAMSAEEAAEAYTAVLQDPEAPEAEQFEPDGFVDQMRTAAGQNEGLEGVTFKQSYQNDGVRHVLRTADGGALAFIDLARSDVYEVKAGITVTWPESSPQQAFIPQGISTGGTLLYKHQVLLLIPGGKGKPGKPRVIGQFGGPVGAEGF